MRRLILPSSASSIRLSTTPDASAEKSTARQHMRKQQLDAVRHALEAALRNLSGGAGEGGTGSGAVALFPQGSSSLESGSSEAPVIVVLAGELKACSHDATPQWAARVGDTKEPANVNSLASDSSERKLSHPGLERFTIEAESHPSAPKTCFMEPGRTCVNSGACEMRGF